MNSDKIYKRILYTAFIIIISCPVWSIKMKAMQFDKIQGSFKNTVLVDFNIENWFSADYQRSLEEHIVLNNHLSSIFIRISNQIDYSLFNEVHIAKGFMGKDKYMYEHAYIETYYGRDFVGEEKLRNYVRKIKFVQDTLRKLNKEFIYIQAPGKGSFFPEYIPESFKYGNTEVTNYYTLKKLLDEYGINHIDFRPYFLENKYKSKYPLFTQPGIHWSKYAMALVMDSINNFIEKGNNIDLPEISWDNVDIEYAKYEDNDLGDVLNLIFPISSEKYAYPRLVFEPHKNKDTPKVLMVGDSYLGTLYEDGFYRSFDSTSQFWFYNTSVLSLSFPHKLHKYQLKQLDVLRKSDIVILGCAEHNIEGQSWSFIENVYQYYAYGKTMSAYEISFMKKVDSCKGLSGNEILSTSEIKEISDDQGVSMDSAKTIKWLWKLETGQY